MLQIITDIGVWIVIVLEFIALLIMLSFFLFGGRVSWTIELRGPLRFLSKMEDKTK